MVKSFYSKRFKILLHSALWFLFVLVIPVVASYLNKHTGIKFMFFMSLVLVGIFYLNYYVLIPKYLSQKKCKEYIGTLLIFVVIVIILFNLIRPEPPRPRKKLIEKYFSENFEKDRKPKLSRVIFFNFGVLILTTVSLALSTSIRGTREWFTNEEQLKEIENQKLVAELSYLKTQINPHFFFNTLNGIYGLAQQKSDQTPGVILKLSNLMRYIIYDANVTHVSLEKEIDHVVNYIDLQKLRLNEKVSVNLEIKGGPDDLRIAPLLFSVFIENAFKHGIDYSKKCSIDIKLLIDNSSLLFELKNPIPKMASKTLNVGSSGVGLKNIKKRLELIYPDQHRLNIYQRNNMYHVELYLKLRNNEVHYN